MHIDDIARPVVLYVRAEAVKAQEADDTGEAGEDDARKLQFCDA